MRSWLALLPLFLPAGLGAALRGQEEPGPTWHDDLAQASALAAETEKPLLLVFR